ncbi:hypothetical protein [Streptomyces sp. GESEQ-4]|uniref:hypothetical protein n=1 Tax=Streptomyces sp. GESEQ-4 TaxID=2812655 RepID=UPI001FF0AD11|nr:hypothetical protein [Streptomyces sp. GESEQ-4]
MRQLDVAVGAGAAGAEQRQGGVGLVGLGSACCKFLAAQMALFTGLMTQWLTDPGQAPDASEIVAGLRALTGIVDTHE